MDSKKPELPSYIRADADGVVLSLKVQPRASRNAVESPLRNELRVKVTAPPVDSAANEAVIRFLSELLDVPKNRIELLRGHTSRHKQFKIYGLSAAALLSLLKTEH